MPDHKIPKLLEKHSNGTLTGEEDQLLDAWYLSLDYGAEVPLSEAELTELKGRIWKAIKAKTVDLERKRIWRNRLLVAGMVAAIAAASLFFILSRSLDTSSTLSEIIDYSSVAADREVDDESDSTSGKK